MKILVLSDTHGKIDKAVEVYRRLQNIDMLFHCGDDQKDASALTKELDVPVISVAGNCDPADSAEEHSVVPTPAGRILLTHGHKENVGESCSRLLYLAEAEGCIAACFGHTHIPFSQEFSGIHLLNPGSLTLPRGGSRSSFAVIESLPDRFHAEIFNYDDFIRQSSSGRKKVQGGYLRKLLNYSDRF